MTPSDKFNELLAAIARSLGGRLSTPRDFELLSDRLQERTGERLSVSTLKRLWGYVPNAYTPSQHTLDLLAHFVGYGSWEQFAAGRAVDSRPPSDPILSRRLSVAGGELPTGGRVRLLWPPGRECVVEHQGGSRFVVLESKATRLQPGDTFVCGLIIEGEPLYLDDLCQAGRAPSAYVCGQVSGVRFELLQ